MLAEILTIGDEVCRGEIVDTNSSFLAAELWDLDVTTGWMTSCRDVGADIVRALGDAAGRADLILVSGGLGPTTDDLTVEAIARAAGVGVVTDEAALARMKERYARGHFPLQASSLRQVRIPEGAESLGNPVGIAPGFTLRLGKATIYAFPGVPGELEAIWTSAAAPRIAAAAASGDSDRIARRILRVFGLGESVIDDKLAGLIEGVAGATLHYQVVFPETLVKIVVRDRDAAAASARLAALEAEARARLGVAAYGFDEGQVRTSLSAVLGRALKESGATLAVAESCTGGMLGELITDEAGASDYFVGGFITYSNQAKMRDLGVAETTLASHGAVSEECVIEMARGARARAGATFGAATSGIAGPGGGTPDKPVGTVHVAVAGEGDGALSHRRFVFPGSRAQVRRLAAYWAMAMIVELAKTKGIR